MRKKDLLLVLDPSGTLSTIFWTACCVVCGIWSICTDMVFVGIILLLVAVIIIAVVITKSVRAKKAKDLLLEAMAKTNIASIKDLSPVQFEEWIANMFTLGGYKASLTPKSNDYGVDVLLEKEGVGRIAVQVKMYNNPVGVKAVQEVIAGKQYYGCNYGWVITSAPSFTRQAITLANNSNIKLIAHDDLALLLAQMQKEYNNKSKTNANIM